MDAPFGSWGTQTFISGLTADALIAPWVIKGAMDGDAFAAYIEKVLVPELEPGTVVILDNLATHKNAAAAKAMRDAGCWFLFLPPYSSDLNPMKWRSRNSKHTCAESALEPSQTCSTPLPKSVNSFRRKNAGTTSRLPDMKPIKRKTL